MKSLDIQNCHVQVADTGASIHCEFGGLRYHIRLNDDGTARAPLYKNPPLDVSPDSKANFKTRELKLTTRVSSRLVATMLARMQTEGLYDKAVQEHAEAVAKEEKERRDTAPQHLVIGVDRDGRIFLVGDDGVLRQDIREAAVFTEHGLEQAVAIANQTDLEQRRRCPQLAVITITARDLERLTQEEASST